jgi:outer membrane protein OmpA-like peptidoglycan-associated protein
VFPVRLGAEAGRDGLRVRAIGGALQGSGASPRRSYHLGKDRRGRLEQGVAAVLAALGLHQAAPLQQTAAALAQTKFAEAERVALNEQSEKARLDARTHEADLAKSDAETAQLAANASQQQASLLQRQLEILQARPTDRGLVLTLGDTLFATGRSELKSGATANLDRLSAFMTEYPQRTAAIEGFTDSMGSEEYNQDLSQRRADSVSRRPGCWNSPAQLCGTRRELTGGRQ